MLHVSEPAALCDGLVQLSVSTFPFSSEDSINKKFRLTFPSVTEVGPCVQKLPSIVCLCLSTQLYEAVLLYNYCMDKVFTEAVFMQLCFTSVCFLQSDEVRKKSFHFHAVLDRADV